MKKILFGFSILFLALGLPAETSPPARLALVSESAEASSVADVLTAELSSHKNLQLLERNEIEKVYREQGLSAGNKDYLKLGQILGADGLLLLESVEEGTNQFSNIPSAIEKPRMLNVRLIAIRSGVVLAAEKFSLLVKDLPEWSSSFSKHLNLFLPKLTVLAKDAIPISVVNLRSAVSSTDASETERQLKTLTIQRLSQEPQMFVLERQRMQLLSEEKDLKSDESAFWNGSYLLEGVVDQNGYSKDTVAINARLTPPKGGEPLLFEVSGSRTNLAAVVNLLTVKVAKLLKVNSVTKEWNAADEAAQYFNEAQWALRWGIFAEAQTAADSAWALGKKDLACARLRIRAYVLELSANIGSYQNGQSSVSSGFDVNGKPLGPAPSDARVERLVQEIITGHKFVKITKITSSPGSRGVLYVCSDKAPSAENIDRSIHALELYEEFSRTSPDGEPKILSRGKGWNDWHNSEWYQLGIDDLVAASKVLQSFNLAPDAQKPVTDKLTALRALERSVAGRISAAPSVHDSYFVGDRVVSHDELAHTIEEHDNIFRCETDWGCYWQEKPEECLALYRELLASPVFCYIHHDFWSPKPPASHLAAWNEDDQKRLPALWNSFVGELNNSTNVLLQMEAKALVKADATSEDQARAAEADWWSLVRSHREELVANNVELFYLGWGFAANPETEAMDQEYWQKTIPAKQMVGAFEKQKHYLASFTPYDWNDFNATFNSRDYTKTQAAELQPLIAAYKSNLLAQVSPQTPPAEKFKAQNNVRWVEFFLEQRVNAALNPPAPVPQPPVPPPQQTPPVISQPTLAAKSKASNSVSNQTPEVVTNVLLVNKFLPIPLDGLPGDKISAVTITAHHWLEGKLLLDFQYGAFVYSFDENGNWKSTRNVTFPAIAILDPATEHWQVISCPEVDFASRNRFYHHTTLWRGEAFTSDGGHIKKYDAVKKAWQVLEISDMGNCELFAVNGQLYAATPNLIVEILEGGTRTHILASNRRQPPVSALDTENLGTPALFTGPGRSLRAAAGNKIVAWDGENWRTVCPAPQAPMPPVISDDGIVFLADGWNAPAGIWRLATESDRVEFCLGQEARRGIGAAGSSPDKDSKPAWKLPPEFSLPRLPTASRGPDLYLMADHAKSQDIVNEQEHLIIGKTFLTQNGYHAELLCFASNYPAPQKIFLKFDSEDACLPVTGDNHPAGFMRPNLPSGWLLFSTNYLFCGRETSDAIPSGGGDPRISEPKTGVWMISLEQIDTEIARQKKAQQEQQIQSNAQAKQAAQTLLEKYDRTHSGVIDPDERETALDDPALIESELDLIDTNHNGWLEAAELVYFDANQNKLLDPKEQAGIGITRQLLVEKLFKQFDQSGNGWLRMPEYNEMIESSLHLNANAEFNLQFVHADSNHDNRVSREELEKLLQDHMEMGLGRQGMRRPGVYNPMYDGVRQTSDAGERFKTAVESYWQNPGEAATRPPFFNQIPMGAPH